MTKDEMVKGLRYKAANIKAHMEPEFFAEVADYLEEQKVDAISREDAMFLILHYGNEIRHEVMDDIKASMIKLPSVTPKQKTGEWIELKDHKPEALEDVLVRDIDGDVTCAYLCDDTDFLERFSGEIIDDVVEWMEMPG